MTIVEGCLPAEAGAEAVTEPLRRPRLASMSMAMAAVLPLAFLAIGVLRAYPFVDDVSLPSSNPDDWHTYKQLALSVLRDGLSMPALGTSYAGLPHGFLYVYFVALVFAVLGVNSTYVYVVQSVALGLSISLTYLVVRKRVTPVGGLIFLLTLTSLMYVDVFRHLTFRLLSENLYFFLSPLLMIVLFRSIERTDRRRLDLFLAGVMLGLVVLTRPSFILSAAMVVAAVSIHLISRERSSGAPALLLLGSLLGVSGVVARNYAVTGRATFDIVTDTSDWLRMWSMPTGQFLTLLVKRSSFVLGWTAAIAPAYRLRPYWMILWFLWASYPVFLLSKRRPFEFWELLLYIYVTCYIGPVLLVAADLTSYGGRMVIAILPVVLIPAFRLLFADERHSSSGQSSTADQVRRMYVRH